MGVCQDLIKQILTKSIYKSVHQVGGGNEGGRREGSGHESGGSHDMKARSSKHRSGRKQEESGHESGRHERSGQESGGQQDSMEKLKLVERSSGGTYSQEAETTKQAVQQN